MEWDQILEEEFSDARLNALFAGNPEKQCQIKDLHGELLAISNYSAWSSGPDFAHADECAGRKGFRERLSNEIGVEGESVLEEWWALWNTATGLGQWEYGWLDHDGKTMKIRHELRIGIMDVFGGCEEARVKYKYLVPTGYDATPLGCFEYEWLDEEGGTSRIEEELKQGRNMFRSRPEEVQNKYAEVVARHLDPIMEFECDYDVEKWGMMNIEEHLRNGHNVFEGRDGKVLEKYGHLMPLFNSSATWPPEEWSNPAIHVIGEEFEGDAFFNCVEETAL